MSTGRHPKADVAAALDAAKKAGLEVEEDHKGHRWGWLICPNCDAPPAKIWGTPRNPGTHGKQLARYAAEHKDHRSIPEQRQAPDAKEDERQ